MKEYEYSQEFCPDQNVESPSSSEIDQYQLVANNIDQQQNNVEIVEDYQSKFENEQQKTPRKAPRRSPLPHEFYGENEKEDPLVWNIYNCSPSAVEKREKMASKVEEIKELEKSNLLPQLLEINKNSDSVHNFPLLLNKSLSEGWDPFESVKRSLSNGTLQREKIFQKFKVSEEVRIGGKAGSIFKPFVRGDKISHRTASSSYDSHNNEEQEVKSQTHSQQAQISSKFDTSQNLNRSQSWNLNEEQAMDKNLFDYLDNYPTDVLQKTALILLEKSLSRPKSFQVKETTQLPMNSIRSSNISEKESTKNEILSEENSNFKPWNCRKSKWLKLYCECFSNGRKCTSKCDCFSCWNTPAHESLILKSKEQILARNPDAFKPKFTDEEELKNSTSKKHQRGCNCQKSNCLKKYCEWFQKGVECGELCRCVGCHNCKEPNKKETFLGK